HVTGLLPTHAPAWHVSACVHAFPSLHAAPFAFGGSEHTPDAGLQVPASWHWSAATHVTGLPPTHAPACHGSGAVQTFPSLHAVPFAFGGVVHAPDSGLHTPASWHWSAAAQITGVVPTHAPDTHASTVVQAFPSLHAVPSGAGGAEHLP